LVLSPDLEIVAFVSVSDPPLTTRKTFWSAVLLAHVPPSMVAAMPSTRYAPDSFCVPPPPPGPDWLDVNVASYVPAESFVLPAAAADVEVLADPEADAAGLAVDEDEQPTRAPTPSPVPSQRTLRRVIAASSSFRVMTSSSSPSAVSRL